MKRIILLTLIFIFITGCAKQEPIQQSVIEPEQGGEIMPKALFVIAPNNFKDEEYFTPKNVLEKGGIKVVTTSTASEANSVGGKKVKVDVLLDSTTTNYDAIVFIGGPGASVYLNNDLL